MSGGDCDLAAGELSRRGAWLDGGRAGGPWGLGPEAPGDRVGRLRLVEASSAESWGRPAGIEAEVQAVSLDSRPPSLLDLIDVMDPLPGLTGVAGLDEAGSPILLPLKSRYVWNLLITGNASSGKSEWLRALVMSLALTTSPERLGIVGVDLGGRELAVLESLPHSVAEISTSLDQAHELLAWLDAEMDRRLRGGVGEPDIALVIDDLRWTAQPKAVPAAALLGRLWARGWQSGIHVLAAGPADPFGAAGALARGHALASRPGWFDLMAGRETARVHACRLSAWELDLATRRAGQGLGQARSQDVR